MVRVNQFSVSLGRQASMTYICTYVCMCAQLCHVCMYIYIFFLNVMSYHLHCDKMAINSSWIKEFSISTPEDSRL